MNKKVLTLCAGFLLAGSLTAFAQYCPQDGEVAYRTRLVNSATLDATFEKVTEINSGYYYQLQVKTDDGSVKVLTVERDYSTGKLYLTSRKIEDAALTHSLWKITTTPSLVHGQAYSFENKETGYKLTLDHTNALQLDGSAALASSDGNANWEYLKDGLLDGCNDKWELYTTNVGFDNYSPVYSYFHNNADSVMFLADEKALDLSGKVYGFEKKRVGVDSDFDGSTVVVSFKESKAKAGDNLRGVESLALQVKPVIAGAKVLNAAEINTMIDADGSFLSFTDISRYDEWSNATEGAKAGKSTKFMIRKPGSNELVELAQNPLAGEFVAEASPYTQLARENYDEATQAITADKNAYAGYDILIREKAKAQGGYKYLMVSEKMYDGVETGNYQGLEVTTNYYSHIDGDETLTGNKRVYEETAVKSDSYKGDAKIVDPLEARYHWKVTYYPSNDSLVFEPLNASRFSQSEYAEFKAGRLTYEKSRLATAWGKNYFNTVNEGKAYDTTEPDRAYNSVYNKAAGVPVALFAMNESAVGDASKLLTVSAAGGVIDANLDKYAAVPKFDKTTDESKTNGATNKNNPAYVTNKTEDDAYVAAQRLRISFNNNYSYLKRATVKSGLYFMNLVKPAATTTQTENRVDGAYVVADMKGHVVYDTVENGLQDFTHMPATQWVVEQQPCDENLNVTPTVAIYNREFNGKNWFTQFIGNFDDEPVFEGQLYVDENGSYYTINHREYARDYRGSNVDEHEEYSYNCADRVAFNEVKPQTTDGFFNENEAVLRETTYTFEQIFDEKTNGKFLGLDASRSNYLRLVDNATEFELYRAEGWYPVPATQKVFDRATGKEIEEVIPGKYDFEYRDSVEYGYSSAKADVKPLYKTFFKLKVKDENLIDNDHKFLAIDNQHKYVLATEAEIAKPENHLTFAIVSLKENNDLNGIHGYAIINQPQFTVVNGTKNELKGLDFDHSHLSADGYVEWKKDGKTMVTMSVTAWNQIGKLTIENSKLDAKIADLCETSTEAFALVSADRKLYRTLDAEVVNNSKKVIDLVTVDEQGAESLFEDSKSATAVANKLNYLAAENLGNQTKREGFYVDKVAKSSASMPQYLLAVAADSVPAYTYCSDNIHGINPSCGHDVEVPGYVEGRFLVNFNDSITDAIDKLTKRADAFKYNNYVRLGFVEGIHQGDNLYILKNGTTLKSIKVADKSGKEYVNPTFFAKENEGKLYDVVALDGKHNNAAFSFRETGDAENSFMIESNDIAGLSQIGSFAGAWIKINNNVPVLTQYVNINGSHNTGDSTDSWKQYEDLYTNTTFGEAINQAARFTSKTIDKNASATANETIATSDVTVAATTGAVVVKGAAGKSVVVTNILGQTLVNEVISSDNATITVPAGIAVVAVDGEEAVKVVVK